MRQQWVIGTAALAASLCSCPALAVPSPGCVADLTGDTLVNGLDLVMLLGQWGQYSPCPPYKPADLNQDCRVNGIDLGMLIGAWMSCDPGSSVSEPVLPPGVWSRSFPKLTPAVPVTVQGTGPSFTASSPILGALRVATAESLWWDAGPLNMQAQVTPKPSGFDVQYTITNATTTAKPLPTLQVPGMVLPAAMTHLTLPFATTFKPLVWQQGVGVISEQNPYPTTRYAPVAVLKNDNLDRAVGVSLQYPVLQYKHAVSPEFRRYAFDTHWRVWVVLDGQIPAGHTRTYRVTVRYAHPVDWIHTLEPYREYFWSTYGNLPQYSQDLRPVYIRPVGYTELISMPDNPRGMRATYWPDGQIWRPDTHGWKREVDYVLNYMNTSGYERLMMWTPSGMYSSMTDPETSRFPSRIMTDWTGPMVSSQGEFQRIVDAGKNLGFWWGDSAQVAPYWDPPYLDPLNISSSAHQAIMLPQMQLASQRGAMTVGLDSIRMLALWDTVPWLGQIGAINPDIKFVAEPNCNDIMHNLMPVVTMDVNLSAAPLLADYLVPGRAIWAVMDAESDTLSHAYRYIGWGLAVANSTEAITAHQLMPWVQQAQSGWVLPWDAPLLPSPPMP